MPPTDARSTRATPPWLPILAALLLLARVALALWNASHERPRAEVEDAIRWRDAAVAEAEARHRGGVVLYDFTADWCAPCRAMRNDVFTDRAFARKLEAAGVVPVRVLDRKREDGRNRAEVDSLQRLYRADGFPTLVMIEPAGGRFDRLEGYPGAARTREWLLGTAERLRAPAPAGAAGP